MAERGVVDQEPQDPKMPAWASNALIQIAAVRELGRALVVIVFYSAALLVEVWLILGLYAGFVSMAELLGVVVSAGGIRGIADVIRRSGKSENAGKGPRYSAPEG